MDRIPDSSAEPGTLVEARIPQFGAGSELITGLDLV